MVQDIAILFPGIDLPYLSPLLLERFPQRLDMAWSDFLWKVIEAFIHSQRDGYSKDKGDPRGLPAAN
jgi:hypothetical protein